MYCFVIEDDLVQKQLLINHIHETESLDFVKSYNDPISAAKDLQQIDSGIIFLDIETPEMSGLEFIENYSLPSKANIIITTSDRNYTVKAFDNSVSDFLLKPISYARFLKAVNRVLKQNITQTPAKDYLFIKSGRVRIKIMFNDILWIKSASEYIIIYTTKSKYVVYSSMSSILKRLPNSFIRVHRSNIVSLDKIDRIHRDFIEIGNQIIKVSKRYKNSLKAKIELY